MTCSCSGLPESPALCPRQPSESEHSPAMIRLTLTKCARAATFRAKVALPVTNDNCWHLFTPSFAFRMKRYPKRSNYSHKTRLGYSRSNCGTSDQRTQPSHFSDHLSQERTLYGYWNRILIYFHMRRHILIFDIPGVCTHLHAELGSPLIERGAGRS